MSTASAPTPALLVISTLMFNGKTSSGRDAAAIIIGFHRFLPFWCWTTRSLLHRCPSQCCLFHPNIVPLELASLDFVLNAADSDFSSCIRCRITRNEKKQLIEVTAPPLGGNRVSRLSLQSPPPCAYALTSRSISLASLQACLTPKVHSHKHSHKPISNGSNYLMSARMIETVPSCPSAPISACPVTSARRYAQRSTRLSSPSFSSPGSGSGPGFGERFLRHPPRKCQNMNMNVNTSAAASAIHPPLSSDHTPDVNSFLMVVAVPMSMPTRRSRMSIPTGAEEEEVRNTFRRLLYHSFSLLIPSSLLLHYLVSGPSLLCRLSSYTTI